jgi:hypothetical protein
VWYELSHYIKEIRFIFKGLNSLMQHLRFSSRVSEDPGLLECDAGLLDP